jgi:hypothetical protein
MLGAILSGYLADRISRKWTRVVSGSVYVLAGSRRRRSAASRTSRRS